MPEKMEEFVFGGFGLPRYTTVPDEVFDILMARLSGAELKVLLYIVRRTFGFKKEADTISIAQMCNGIRRADGSVLDNGTGLSRQSVITAVKALEAMGVIAARRNSSSARGDEATTYSLHIVSAKEGSEDVAGQKNRPAGVKKADTPLSKNMAGGIQKHDPQQTALQQTEQHDSLSNDSTDTPTISNNAELLTENGRKHRQNGENRGGTPLPPSGQEASPTLDACVADYSREMGDSTHVRVNIARMRRLWHESGISEEAFCEQLHAARQKMRERQMAAGGVRNRAAYFFTVLEQSLLPQSAPAEPQITTPASTDVALPSVPAWWQSYAQRYQQTG